MTRKTIARRVNSNDVAALAQVSRSAVSRTFTPGTSVAPDTRERIIAAAGTLGYNPTPRKKKTATRNVQTIAVIMANLLSPYFAELGDRLNGELASKGLRALFFVSSSPSAVDEIVLDALSRDVQGVIIFSAVPSAKTIAVARAAHVPIVISNRNETVDGASLVWIDGAEVGRSVAQRMLARRRHRPLAIATTPGRSRELQSFAETMEAAGSAPCQWIDTEWSYEDGMRAAERFTGGYGLPDAIFAQSDALAIGFMDRLRALHDAASLQHISIMGFGNTAPSSWISHPISTVRLPIVSLIQTIVSTLVARMTSADEPPPRIWLGCDIVERDGLAEISASDAGRKIAR